MRIYLWKKDCKIVAGILARDDRDADIFQAAAKIDKVPFERSYIDPETTNGFYDLTHLVTHQCICNTEKAREFAVQENLFPEHEKPLILNREKVPNHKSSSQPKSKIQRSSIMIQQQDEAFVFLSSNPKTVRNFKKAIYMRFQDKFFLASEITDLSRLVPKIPFSSIVKSDDVKVRKFQGELYAYSFPIQTLVHATIMKRIYKISFEHEVLPPILEEEKEAWNRLFPGSFKQDASTAVEPPPINEPPPALAEEEMLVPIQLQEPPL